MDMFFGRYGYHGASFEQTYRCYPASFIDKSQIENGDKVIMPPSALDRLEEGTMYMPYWMMENLLLQEGDFVRVKNVTLPKGTYVKLQPHTKDFLDISNPKAILETTLRNFSCLSTGDSIMVAYNNRKYYIDIIETKPSNAISIIEIDYEVDFAPPLDYKEAEKPAVSIPTGKPLAEGREPPADTGPKFNPFTGVARRLDGKPLITQPALVTSNVRTDAPTARGQASTSGFSSLSNNRLSEGRLVFGSNTDRSHQASKETSKGTTQEQPKSEEPKFQAFSGKKYSLMG